MNVTIAMKEETGGIAKNLTKIHNNNTNNSNQQQQHQSYQKKSLFLNPSSSSVFSRKATKSASSYESGHTSVTSTATQSTTACDDDTDDLMLCDDDDDADVAAKHKRWQNDDNNTHPDNNYNTENKDSTGATVTINNDRPPIDPHYHTDMYKDDETDPGVYVSSGGNGSSDSMNDASQQNNDDDDDDKTIRAGNRIENSDPHEQQYGRATVTYVVLQQLQTLKSVAAADTEYKFHDENKDDDKDVSLREDDIFITNNQDNLDNNGDNDRNKDDGDKIIELANNTMKSSNKNKTVRHLLGGSVRHLHFKGEGGGVLDSDFGNASMGHITKSQSTKRSTTSNFPKLNMSLSAVAWDMDYGDDVIDNGDESDDDPELASPNSPYSNLLKFGKIGTSNNSHTLKEGNNEDDEVEESIHLSDDEEEEEAIEAMLSLSSFTTKAKRNNLDDSYNRSGAISPIDHKAEHDSNPNDNSENSDNDSEEYDKKYRFSVHTVPVMDSIMNDSINDIVNDIDLHEYKEEVEERKRRIESHKQRKQQQEQLEKLAKLNTMTLVLDSVEEEEVLALMEYGGSSSSWIQFDDKSDNDYENDEGGQQEQETSIVSSMAEKFEKNGSYHSSSSHRTIEQKQQEKVDNSYHDYYNDYYNDDGIEVEVVSTKDEQHSTRSTAIGARNTETSPSTATTTTTTRKKQIWWKEDIDTNTPTMTLPTSTTSSKSLPTSNNNNNNNNKTSTKEAISTLILPLGQGIVAFAKNCVGVDDSTNNASAGANASSTTGRSRSTSDVENQNNTNKTIKKETNRQKGRSTTGSRNPPTTSSIVWNKNNTFCTGAVLYWGAIATFIVVALIGLVLVVVLRKNDDSNAPAAVWGTDDNTTAIEDNNSNSNTTTINTTIPNSTSAGTSSPILSTLAPTSPTTTISTSSSNYVGLYVKSGAYDSVPQGSINDDGYHPWISDSEFVIAGASGAPFTVCPATVADLSYTDDPYYEQSISCSERFWESVGRYEIPVSTILNIINTNGEFNLTTPPTSFSYTLHFVELFFEGEGQRVFQVIVEDTVVATALDIYKETGGKLVAYTLSGTVSVVDSAISIQLISIVGSPKINAFEIHPIY